MPGFIPCEVFTMTRPKIYGIGDIHARNLVQYVTDGIDDVAMVFRGVTYKPPHLKKALEAYDKAKRNILKPQRGVEVGKAWEELKSAVEGLPLSYETKRGSLGSIMDAKEIIDREAELVRSMRPEILYTEGDRWSYLGVFHPAIHAAEHVKAKVVYLDKGPHAHEFTTERDMADHAKMNDWQQKREQRWKLCIKANPVKKIGMIIVGYRHLYAQNSSCPFVGNIPEMIDELGMDFELVENFASLRILYKIN